MNRNRFISLAALLLLPFAPACYISGGHSGGGGGGSVGRAGDVTFFWSFEGANCSQERRIRYVRVTIPGEALENDGYYGCNNAGSDGIVLHNFAPGTYHFQLDSIDADGYYSYSAAGSFTVNGNVEVDVDLALN